MSKQSARSAFKFQHNYRFDLRVKESKSIMDKYPDRVPVIVERFKGISSSDEIGDIDKSKYIVPKDLTFGQFIHVIRKRLPRLTPEKALFVFVGAGKEPEDRWTLPEDVKAELARLNLTDGTHVLPTASSGMNEIYSTHHHVDGFLYMRYTGENVFGDDAALAD